LSWTPVSPISVDDGPIRFYTVSTRIGSLPQTTPMPSEYADLNAHIAETALPPATGQRFIRDSKLAGFALRITSTGAKSWIVEAAVKGKKYAKRRTIGRYPAVQADRARRLAIQELGRFAEGKDTLSVERTERARSLTLEDVFTDYMESRNLKDTTAKDYRYVFQASFSDWKTKRVTSITRSMVENRHKRDSEKSHARANLAMRLLRALFNYAIGRYEDGDGNPVVTDNPVTRLSATRAWHRIDRRKTLIRLHQLPAWYDALESLRKKDPKEHPAAGVVADWLEFLLLTGCRRTESLELRWRDVDLDGRLFRLPDPKNRQLHELPLSDRLLEILQLRKALNVERRRKAGEDLEDGSDFVFPGEGRTGHLVNERPQLDKVTEASGIRVTPHDLRRTFATIAEGLNVPAYTLKRLLNHASGAGGDVTAGYLQIDVERLRVPMQQITDTILQAARRDKGNSSTVVDFPLTQSSPAE
jgi:integrase